MKQFFKSWRRKIGVVTLVMGLAVTAVWIRSLRTRDAIVGPLPGSVIVLKSFEGRFGYERMYPDPAIEDGWAWTSESDLVCSITDPWYPLEIFRQDEIQRNWKWTDFQHGIAHSGDDHLELLIFPYWSIVIPVTLLSAWLLLSKPQPAKKPVIRHDRPKPCVNSSNRGDGRRAQWRSCWQLRLLVIGFVRL